MKALLNKEFRLNMHPAAPMFVLLSAMVLIPNYPLYVAFFYTALGLFFTCLQGREDRDLAFTMTLPVRKRQIVGARFLFALIIEGAQLVLCVAFAALRNRIMPNPRNMAGMDANVAFFGGALAVLGVFHMVFFPRYYRRPDQVGRAFVFASIAMFLAIFALEACVFAVPFARDVLDVPGLSNLPQQCAVLALGAAAFALLTIAAYRRSVHSFETLDL